MLPSAVAREARENLLDYLQTTYALTDAKFERALLDFLSGTEGMFRGPYLDVRLPFRQAKEGAALPLEIAPPFRPYRHQMRAFERLHGERGHQPQHTLITTGTGSGKTECFLYPILDHCWRERKKGRRGIKAILLYPMNALATDQARRLATMLWDDERLKGKISAGLYVGGKGSHKMADREHLIDDRKMLRQAPPDILLTNYKMLDFLLLRPEDQVLWRDNGPETLRFLVLDELHTYDGAQGSDVACLIRRLKARLETPEGALCCVGTSATIGQGDDDSKELLTRFATEIFDERFLSDSIVVEDRLAIDEAIGAKRDLFKHPGAGDLAALDPRGTSPDEWIARQKELWLGSAQGAITPVDTAAALERHDFLHQLLRALNGRVLVVRELVEKLAIREEWFGQLDQRGRELVLDSFVALISHAKRRSEPDAKGATREYPFLTVQVQMWLREVRSLLRAIDQEPAFQWRSELGGRAAREENRTRYLPMVRCRDCGCTGMAAVQHEGESRLRDDTEEREIGRAWLTRSPDARFVVLGHGVERIGQKALPEYLCPRCLRVSHDETCSCEGPSTPKGLAVRVVRELTQDSHPKFRPLCPECGSDDGLVFLASRASSLLSVAISHLFQTEFNSDPKLLAFVDSVQDASHRAGFFGTRTYRFNLRALVQQMVQERGGEVPLRDVGAKLLEHAEQRLGGARNAIPVLVPEDLRAHPDYEHFLEKGGHGAHNELRVWLAERLTLEVAFEYGFSVRSGRSLEKTGCSTLLVDQVALEKAAQELAMIVREEGLLQSRSQALMPDEAKHFVAGLVNRLRLRGGIHQELLGGYVRSSGNRYLLSRRKSPLGPIFAPESVLPRFLLEFPPRAGKRSAFDAFAADADRLTWYRDWASRCLELDAKDDGVAALYRVALERLEAVGIVKKVESDPDRRPIWGLDPESLTAVLGVRELGCPVCGEVVRLPEAVAKEWVGRPCTMYRCAGAFGESREVRESFYTRIFRSGRVARVFPEEHTGLLQRAARERVEEQFKTGEAPNAPNMLVCTPTLEMGIDIGDLSAVMLCSVPPTTSMYIQRIGRAGRATGNALCITMATTRPHDLYFHADPSLMMAGKVDPPGCFLDAPEMLKRQVVAHAMDRWARQETEVRQIPSQTTAVLAEGAKFPARFLEYFESHRVEIVSDFISRFDKVSLSDTGREELERFALSGQVAERVQLAFDEVRNERSRLKLLQESARRRIDELTANPDLAQTNAEQEKAEAESSLRMLGRLITEQGKRYPLNVLTDAGVLPNYAFPEPGVELDSVIRVDDRGQRRYEPHQYRRPASAAIRELAPFNTFYAEGRRVRIDEIDLGTAAQPLIESWRLCAACSHSVRDGGDSTPLAGCPVCGDPTWTDVSRRRSLVYFRRSRSLATRLEAASADDGEERHKEYYQTHDLIDVVAENRGGARLIPDLPFGFELLTRLKLREVNFGPDTDESFEVAGEKVNEIGFQVCRDCGRVRPQDTREPLDHTPTCRSRRNMEPRIESIYLYREVESEAIRLLLPMADFDIDAQRASFKAALEFGLRRRYGGRAPHLQVKAMREPIRGGGHRNYLVLFDSVPGGTGFLADLWREDALMSVLEDALKGLNACKCVGENKDGCYLCLFAYQNQRDMAVTSSSVARRLLDDIVKKKSTLSDVDTLSDVVLDTKLESELEERFLRTLIARAKKGGEVRKILRAGDERWELQFGEHRWEVRQQVLLGATQGVSEQTRADFVITPLTTSGDPRPIAVYCDGLAYHVCPDEEHSKLGDDVRKRRSIIESGRYLVWSLTWKDVDEFGVGEEEAAPTLLDVAASGPGGAVLKRWGLHAESSLAKKGSMELLWDWLAEPDRALWDRRLAALGAQFVVRQTTLTSSAIESLEEALFLQSLPLGSEAEAVSVKASTETLGNAEGLFGLKLLGRLSMSACRGSEPISPIWTLRLYDDRARRSDPQFHSSWRAFLQAINLLQFVPDFLFATTEDVEARHDEGAGIYLLKREEKSMQMVAERPGPVAPADPLAGLHLLDEEKSLVRGVLDSGGPLPEVGFELLDATGRCIAEAPLAWVSARVAVVFGVELSDLAVFDRAGWRVFGPSEVDELIAVLRASDAERGA